MTLTSEFIGGPCDGMIQDLRPESITGEPPLVMRLHTAEPRFDEDGVLRVSMVMYVRSETTMLHAEFGSVWQYRFVPPPERNA